MKRLVLAAFLAAALYAPSAALAAEPSAIDCDAYVVDQAGVLVGDMKGQADAAAIKLQNVGADPRVVFIDNLGSAGSIDAFERQLVSRCGSWRAADGLRKNNLVALIVAMRERKAVVSWGERWNPSLEAEADRIRSDFLNPNLADGRFGVAVEETLGEVGGLINRQLHPPKQNGKSTSTNLWPLWVILFALGGVGLLVGMFFGLKALAKARREREEAQKQALAARNAAADAVVKMNDAHDDLQTSAEIAKGLLGPEEAEHLAKAVGQASQLVGAAGDVYSTLGTSASDPDKSHRTDEYQRSASGYRDVATQAEAATTSIVEAAQLADELIELTTAVPGGARAIDAGPCDRPRHDRRGAKGRLPGRRVCGAARQGRGAPGRSEQGGRGQARAKGVEGDRGRRRLDRRGRSRCRGATGPQGKAGGRCEGAPASDRASREGDRGGEAGLRRDLVDLLRGVLETDRRQRLAGREGRCLHGRGTGARTEVVDDGEPAVGRGAGGARRGRQGPRPGQGVD